MPQPTSAGYVYWHRGIPSSPAMCMGKNVSVMPTMVMVKLTMVKSTSRPKN